ncbi:hypothetical protein OKJ48_25265 [Streptomyces kunmingensis]|uniref:Uncharacterized protein n=1 Tax=Streptomyces kunmingensis TaxID=68225 RepID=A0ABU6CHR9_9ACTN|nr:hypothetical protein [Streptomyces kunmingensis]MEB3963526.1 hypothetical protein [Streptomyces kunmingensis]
MSGTSRARYDRSEPGVPSERGSDRFSDGPPDPLASLLAKVNKGERIAAPGDNAGDEDRDPYDEAWREHDRHGPYGQGRRRRN